MRRTATDPIESIETRSPSFIPNQGAARPKGHPYFHS